MTLPLSQSSLQQPDYPDQETLARVLSKVQFTQLKALPELILPHDIAQLKQALAHCETGEQLVLHIGDCAEAFSDCVSQVLRSKLLVYEQFRGLLSALTEQSVILIGRIGGIIHAYRGDLINSANVLDRVPDPGRMLEGYYHAAAICNFIRSQYARENDEFFLSHEGLLLSYEQAMTRCEGVVQYNAGTHMLWLGERTRSLSSGHVHYFSSINNVVGVKIGPACNIPELLRILTLLNPRRETGKLLLILRLGAKAVTSELEAVLRGVQTVDVPHTWILDPMHGNTYKTADLWKTRNVQDVVFEVQETVRILAECNEPFGGISLESTYEDVTECVGLGITEEYLPVHYTSLCDPRLNPEQTVEVLTKLADSLKEHYRKSN